LTGPDGVTGFSNFGCKINTNYNNGVGIWLGRGNHQMIRGISVNACLASGASNGTCNGRSFGQFYRYNRGQPGIGIAIASAGGGSGQILQQFWVQGWGVGVGTSWDAFSGAVGNVALGDNNNFSDCTIYNAAIGIYFTNTQNFNNSVTHCSIQAQVPIYAPVGTNVHVYSGNYSMPGENSFAGYYTLSNVTGIVGGNDGNQSSWTFTGKLSNEVCGFGVPITGQDCYDAIALGIAQIFTVPTPHWGHVPCIFQGYDAVNKIVTFRILPVWATMNFAAGTGIYGLGDLANELAAATVVYAGEQQTTFWGNGITVRDILVENPATPTRFMYYAAGFGNTAPGRIERVFFDYDISLYPAAANNCPNLSSRQCQLNITRVYLASQHPFLAASTQGYVEISGTEFGSQFPVPIDYEYQGGQNVTFHFHDQMPYKFNQRVYSGGYNVTTAGVVAMAFMGGGLFDQPYSQSLVPPGAYSGPSEQWRTSAGRAPMWGTRPAPWTLPCIQPATLSSLYSPPAIVPKNGKLDTVQINAPGTGYIPGDSVALVGGSPGGATINVDGVNGSGGIVAFHITQPFLYNPGGTTTTFTSSGGHGTGATWNNANFEWQYTFGFVPIWGGQIYSLCDAPSVGDQLTNTLVSGHHYYSFGQNITNGVIPGLTWNTKGQDAYIHVSDVTLLFNGLQTQFTTDTTYTSVITGIYPDFTTYPQGYIQVYPPVGGTSTTVYTGTTIGQESYSLRTGMWQVPTTNVAQLPTCNSSFRGRRGFVIDSNTSTFWAPVSGGGSTPIAVTCDGTTWRVGG
jgi:hypothetical protein